jgi:hypothetical protein
VQFGGASKLTRQPQLAEAETEWQQYGKDTKDIRLLEAFKEKHKEPLYVRLAEARIEDLKREEEKRVAAERQGTLRQQQQEEEKRKQADGEARARAEAERQRVALLQKHCQERP